MKRLLLGQGSDYFAQQLHEELVRHGFQVRSVLRSNELLAEVESWEPDLVISELRLDDGPTLNVLRKVVEGRRSEVVVVTAYDSMASAFACRELGIRAYWVKPVSAETLIQSSFLAPELEGSIPEVPMSLERAMWEYLNQVLESTGSITQAARALGLDRRSLRRMVCKYSP